MKYIIVIIAFLSVTTTACKKNTSTTPVIPINATMEADFNFKPGTFWIYKDSVSGLTDSAYVTGNTTNAAQLGCVLLKGQPEYEIMNVAINIYDGNASDVETWNIALRDSTFSLAMTNNKDVVESQFNLQPFTFPFKLGNSMLTDGCLLYFDSASVAGILSQMSLDNQNFTNAALLCHSGRSGNIVDVYNDCYYTSPGVGFVKMVFNHPTDSVYRVLELQRYKIVN